MRSRGQEVKRSGGQEVRRSGGHLVVGQTEDGDGGHKEGEGAALYDGEAAPQGHLQYSTVQYSTAQYSTVQYTPGSPAAA